MGVAREGLWYAFVYCVDGVGLWGKVAIQAGTQARA